MKKATIKKAVKKVMPEKEINIKLNANDIADELHKLGDKIVSLSKEAKTKYEKADDKTKKKIIAGAATAVAILSGIAGYKQMKSKKK
jgi:hypothetical protein